MADNFSSVYFSKGTLSDEPHNIKRPRDENQEEAPIIPIHLQNLDNIIMIENTCKGEEIWEACSRYGLSSEVIDATFLSIPIFE